MAEQLVSVEQVDREAAANVWFNGNSARDAGPNVRRMLDGEDDDHIAVQTLARHRLDAIAAIEKERDGLREALSVVVGKLEDGPDAPGHSHDVPGIWDSDNAPEIAGKACQWCAQWSAARAALGEGEKGRG